MTNLLAFHRQKATTDHSKWPRWPFALHSNICIIFYSGSKSFTDTFRFSLSFPPIDQKFTLPLHSFWRVTKNVINIMSKSMSRSSRYILTIGRKGLWTPGRPSPVPPFVKWFQNKQKICKTKFYIFSTILTRGKVELGKICGSWEVSSHIGEGPSREILVRLKRPRGGGCQILEQANVN